VGWLAARWHAALDAAEDAVLAAACSLSAAEVNARVVRLHSERIRVERLLRAL
jgi:hypothetical protein